MGYGIDMGALNGNDMGTLNKFHTNPYDSMKIRVFSNSL